jgi:nitrite reductase/ring-hydroxylating ferredoxin subunit
MTPTPLRDLVNADEGLISPRIFGDPDIYRLELERVFTRTWLFVAHTSEIPGPGDFVTRSMGEDPVLVVRGRDGQVRVFLNVCRHRGRKLCGLDGGNTEFFRCGYHGWTYNNRGVLTVVPFLEAYQGNLDTRQLGLYQAAQVDTYRDLIFATWDPDAPTLADYLGETKWVLDIVFGHTATMEVLGPPMRWVVEADWKLGSANFSGDGHHLATTHGYGVALGLDASRGRRVGHVLNTEFGHCCQMRYCPPGTIDTPRYLALPESLWPEVDRRLTPEQLATINSHLSYTGTIFPNFSYLCVATLNFANTEWHQEAEQPGLSEVPRVSFVSMRQWQPKGPAQMEIWSWALADRDTPEAWKEASRLNYERTFGMAGMHEQDDVENWTAIMEGIRGPMGQRLALNYQMLLEPEPSPAWLGPGTAWEQGTFGEVNERALYKRWLELMT